MQFDIDSVPRHDVRDGHVEDVRSVPAEDGGALPGDPVSGLLATGMMPSRRGGFLKRR